MAELFGLKPVPLIFKGASWSICYALRMRLMLPLVLALSITAPAFAQYSSEAQPGYKLAAADDKAKLGLDPGSPIWESAEDCSAVELLGLFEVQAGMQRYFEVVRDSSVRVVEYTVSSTKPHKATPSPTDYLIEGQKIYIGFGASHAEGYTDCIVASYLGDGGGVEELNRFSLGAEYCSGVYAIDLTGDGVVDLAVPYATGAGGGGGIEVRSIVPTGGLAWFGNDELDSTLFSQSGYINLLDFDSDGDWEIETSAPVLCSACGYQWNDIYTFDNEANNWEIDMPRFAAYYKPQQDFYRQLNAAVLKLAASPASMAYNGKAVEAKYATQIAGQWYALDVFMDGSKVDRTWVSQLSSLVDGWK